MLTAGTMNHRIIDKNHSCVRHRTPQRIAAYFRPKLNSMIPFKWCFTFDGFFLVSLKWRIWSENSWKPTNLSEILNWTPEKQHGNELNEKKNWLKNITMTERNYFWIWRRGTHIIIHASFPMGMYVVAPSSNEST